jgi:hypothetical protein
LFFSSERFLKTILRGRDNIETSRSGQEQMREKYDRQTRPSGFPRQNEKLPRIEERFVGACRRIRLVAGRQGSLRTAAPREFMPTFVRRRSRLLAGFRRADVAENQHAKWPLCLPNGLTRFEGDLSF